MNAIIETINAKTNNLKGVSCSIPKGSFCCVTGLSGSGKSSFAFDTLYIEGQRRYMQTLSSQAKRIVANLPKPELETITGLTPTISVSQKTTVGSPRSTVGTLTEVYDYLRLLYARRATPYCPISLEPVKSRSKEQIVGEIVKKWSGESISLLSPHLRQKKGTLKDELSSLERKGFSRVRLNESFCRISECTDLNPTTAHNLDVVVDRLTIREDNRERLNESVGMCLEISSGMVTVYTEKEEELFSENAYSAASGCSYPPLEPQDFSFNIPRGMCDECHGLGISYDFILDKVIDPNKSIAGNCCSIAPSYKTIYYHNIYDNLAFLYDFSITTPWKELSERAKKVLLYGTEKKWTRMTFINPNTGSTWELPVRWQGIIHEAKTKYHAAKSQSNKKRYEQFMKIGKCASCRGSRPKPYPAAARLFGKRIGEVVETPIEELLGTHPHKQLRSMGMVTF